MTFPDASIGNQWSTGEVTSVMMHDNIDEPLDAVGERVRDSGWTTAVLGNSWVAFDGSETVYPLPKYRLYHGLVIPEGLMASGTLNAAAFTFPVGMRPLKQHTFRCDSDSGTARVDVTSGGVLKVVNYASGGSNTYVSLDNIRFIGEQ